MLTVFMWYCRTRFGGRDLRTDGRSFDNKRHSSIRWWAVCIVFSGQLQYMFEYHKFVQKNPVW
jgi:hypothetical protein